VPMGSDPAVSGRARGVNFMAVLTDVKVLPEHLLESRRKLVAGWPTS
jgi:hypothetical protein